MNSLEVSISQLLHSTDRNLACLQGDLVFQITWIMKTISCSTFTFSAQVFEFVLFPSRERPGHPSAQLQQHQGDCPGSSICEALALSAGKICSVMSRLLQCQLFLTNLTLLEEEGGGFPEAFHVSVMRTSFLKRSRITITHLQAC